MSGAIDAVGRAAGWSALLFGQSPLDRLPAPGFFWNEGAAQNTGRTDGLDRATIGPESAPGSGDQRLEKLLAEHLSGAAQGIVPALSQAQVAGGSGDRKSEVEN